MRICYAVSMATAAWAAVLVMAAFMSLEEPIRDATLPWFLVGLVIAALVSAWIMVERARIIVVRTFVAELDGDISTRRLSVVQ